MITPRNSARDSRGGYVLGVAIQVVLVVLILIMVVFLASRMRMRLDLTEEKLYTLTDSTKRVLGKLDDRLLIEAYFSPDNQLSGQIADARRALRNLLDEYVQNSRGRVIVQYLDPHSDEDIRQKAQRIGIKSQTMSDRGDRTLSYKELWQGVRMRYGGKKQKTIPYLAPAIVPFAYEAALTPAVKALTVTEKPKIGFVSQPAPPAGGGQPGADFRALRELAEIKDQYDIVAHPLSNGALIPDDIETLMVVRPKDLTDRQKYVLDQFLLRGGRLVVFADVDDYSIGQQRMFNRRVMAYDARESKEKFLDQLLSYGVDVGTDILLDGQQQAAEGFAIMRRTQFGIPAMERLFYPYWFHPMPVDWADYADQLAKGDDGNVDEALADNYRESFKPGVSEAAKVIGAPGFYWPCAVDLAEEMPAGVTGEVLLRSSPLALEQAPPQNLNPTGRGRTPGQQQADYFKFRQDLVARFESEPRKQYGLMVEVKGDFTSFWKGKKAPLSPEAQAALDAQKKKEAEAEAEDPLNKEVGEDPVKDGEEKPAKDDDENKPAGEDRFKPEEVGPPVAPGDEAQDAEIPTEDVLEKSAAPGRLIVIGDSDCIRDDIVSGAYARTGGPYSRTGGRFFVNMLDWLAEDQDLFDLRNKIGVDRTLRFSGGDEDATGAQSVDQVRSKQFWVRALNIGIPPFLLLVFGLVVFVRRRMAKKTFIDSLGS